MGGVRDQTQWETLGKHPTTERHPRPFFLFIGEHIFSTPALLIMKSTSVDTCEHVFMWMKAFRCSWRVPENRGAGLHGSSAHQLRNSLTVSHGFAQWFQFLHFLTSILSFIGLIPAGTVCRWLVICILGAWRPLHLRPTRTFKSSLEELISNVQVSPQTARQVLCDPEPLISLRQQSRSKSLSEDQRASYGPADVTPPD